MSRVVQSKGKCEEHIAHIFIELYEQFNFAKIYVITYAIRLHLQKKVFKSEDLRSMFYIHSHSDKKYSRSEDGSKLKSYLPPFYMQYSYLKCN